jgi:TonB family protein
VISSRSQIAVFSSIAVHGVLAALMLTSFRLSELESGSPGRVTVEISGIEIGSPPVPKTAVSISTTKTNASSPIADASHALQSHTAAISLAAKNNSGSENSSASTASVADSQSRSISPQALNGYFSLIREKISHSVHPPRARLLFPLKTTLRLTLLETGVVKDRSIEQSSGSADFDSSILTALDQARPFPPFSKDMSGIHEVTLKLPIEVRPQ